MKYWHSVLGFAACCLSQAAAAYAGYLSIFNYDGNTSCNSDCDRLAYSPLRINAEGIVGRGLGRNNEDCALELFFAPALLCRSDWQPFIDIKGHHLGSSNSWAANAGIGIRQQVSCDRTLGLNVFYDYRKHRKADFNQVGVGLESLGECVDLRINGYFPFKNRVWQSTLFDDYYGGYRVRASRFWVPMAGVDGEVGFTFLKNSCSRLYGAIGPYYYQNVECHGHGGLSSRKSTTGGMARLSYQWTQYLGLEVKATYDKLFKTKVQGILQLTLPFDECLAIFKQKRNASTDIFLKPVERREVIVLHKSGIHWTGNY